MAINDVSLTAGMRSNLLALQGTVDLLNRTQSRLSTGKKVNSAIDNPVSFFASQALTSRASIIDGLKDAMGQAVQTISSADKGIKAITSMIEQAKGIAQSALSAAGGATSTLSTVGAHAFTAGTVNIDVSSMQQFVAGTVAIDVSGMTPITYGTVTIDVAAMASFTASDVDFELSGTIADGNVVNVGGATFTYQTTVTDPLTEFSDADELAALISGIEGFTAVNNAGTITVTTDGVLAGTIDGNGTANVNVNTVGQLGDTLDVDGTTYMKGATTNGFADAAALDTILQAAGYTAATTGESIDVSMASATVTVAEFNASEVTSVVVDQAEVDGDTISWGGNDYMAGVDFTSAATLATLLQNNGYANSTSSGNIVTAAITGTTVATASFSEVGGIAIAVGTSQIAGDTITFGGSTYTAGTDFTSAATLLTLVDAVYGDSTVSGNVVTAAITGTTVATASFSEVGSIAIAVGTAEAAASTFSVDGTTYTAGTDFAVGGTDTITATNLAAAITGQAGVESATATGTNVEVVLASTELESLQDQYNTLRTQLSALAGDSGYKGKNLLANDDLAVKFEGTTLTVEGFDASATGLGITAATWTAGGNINTDINLLDASLVTLRQESSKMSGNLSIITVRQEFSTNMINTLTEGSDKLTLADANEEGANMLMLQTRQSLSTTALSMSAQAAQSVLRLFQ